MHAEEETAAEREEYKGDVAMSIHDHDDIQYIEGYDIEYSRLRRNCWKKEGNYQQCKVGIQEEEELAN